MALSSWALGESTNIKGYVAGWIHPTPLGDGVVLGLHFVHLFHGALDLLHDIGMTPGTRVGAVGCYDHMEHLSPR